MEDRSLFRIPHLGHTAEQRRREEQYLRRNLRIALRQLERAQLYIDSLESLNLDDREVDATVRDITARLRALARYLSERGAFA